ncbi:MAG: porphobilinogen synthase [Prevotella sp.]|nr:porphobilinogen synthase [Prevotella sp.]
MKRFRQYRTTQAVRDQWADVPELTPQDFIYPYFVVDGKGVKQEIGSMKEVYHFSIDTLLEDIAQLLTLGIDKVLLFGVIPQEEKDERGSLAYSPDSIVARAVRTIKEALPQVTVMTDVCLCEYTSHGHCGLLDPPLTPLSKRGGQNASTNGNNSGNSSQTDSSYSSPLLKRGVGGESFVDNDSTLPLLAEMAYQHALAGADFVAPSAMMDGQVEAIRQRLDSDERTRHTRIMAYSAKYASAYYGPFRDAAQSAPSFGDRRSYQMDYRTRNQGLEEIAADISEGADWVMVKPAMAYLDIIQRATDKFTKHPMVAYQVSGEYSMLLNAAKEGLFDEWSIFHESLTAIRRAGAQYIISYYAKRYALLTNQH